MLIIEQRVINSSARICLIFVLKVDLSLLTNIIVAIETFSHDSVIFIHYRVVQCINFVQEGLSHSLRIKEMEDKLVTSFHFAKALYKVSAILRTKLKFRIISIIEFKR